jgi:tRNA-2-methylthio-N6-dimethylallyladenosine synthase
MHLPVQSGNDRIPEVMRRKVTVDEYRERIKWLRDAVPDMAISTDLIVGFPGETDAEFEDTLKLVEEVQYSFIYAFKYSPRKGTAAARMPVQVPESVMDERLARLNALQDSITLRQTESERGKTREVLFLYERKESRRLYGRTEHFRLVRVESDRPLRGRAHACPDYRQRTALIGTPVHDRGSDKTQSKDHVQNYR